MCARFLFPPRRPRKATLPSQSVTPKMHSLDNCIPCFVFVINNVNYSILMSLPENTSQEKKGIEITFFFPWVRIWVSIVEGSSVGTDRSYLHHDPHKVG